MDKYFENFWDCPNCGTKNISALRKMRCPNCGGSKTTQDFENARMVEITDSYGLKLAKSGKNWACGYCHSVNLDTEQRCSGCYADRSEEIKDAFRIEDVTEKIQGYDTEAAPTYNDAYGTRRKHYEKEGIVFEPTVQTAWTTQNKYREPSKPSWVFTIMNTLRQFSTIQWVVVGVIALILLGSGLIYMTKCSYPGTLDSFYWERSVNVQIYKRLHESGWSQPYSAYNVNSYRKLHHYKPIYETRMVTEQESYTVTTYQTRTRYVSNGNGSTRAVTSRVPSYQTKYRTVTRPKQVKVRDQPIYRTYYEYEINRWVRYTTLHTNGTDKHNIYWAKFVPKPGGASNLGATRQGYRNQILYIYAKWKKGEKDELAKFKVDSYNGLFIGDKLQVNYLMGKPTGIKFDLKAEQI